MEENLDSFLTENLKEEIDNFQIEETLNKAELVESDSSTYEESIKITQEFFESNVPELLCSLG